MAHDLLHIMDPFSHSHGVKDWYVAFIHIYLICRELCAKRCPVAKCFFGFARYMLFVFGVVGAMACNWLLLNQWWEYPGTVPDVLNPEFVL